MIQDVQEEESDFEDEELEYCDPIQLDVRVNTAPTSRVETLQDEDGSEKENAGIGWKKACCQSDSAGLARRSSFTLRVIDSSSSLSEDVFMPALENVTPIPILAPAVVSGQRCIRSTGSFSSDWHPYPVLSRAEYRARGRRHSGYRESSFGVDDDASSFPQLGGSGTDLGYRGRRGGGSPYGSSSPIWDRHSLLE